MSVWALMIRNEKLVVGGADAASALREVTTNAFSPVRSTLLFIRLPLVMS